MVDSHIRLPHHLPVLYRILWVIAEPRWIQVSKVKMVHVVQEMPVAEKEVTSFFLGEVEGGLGNPLPLIVGLLYARWEVDDSQDIKHLAYVFLVGAKGIDQLRTDHVRV